MEKCNYHDKLETTIEAIEVWKAVDMHRQDSAEVKLEKICNSITNIEKWLTKIEKTLPATYETRQDSEREYQRLHGRIDGLRNEIEERLSTTIKNAITVTGIVASVGASAITLIVNLLLGG